MNSTQPEIPLILNQHLAAAIGELIATWSGMQSLLARALTDLIAGRALNDDEFVAPAVVVLGMEARVQIGLLKTLLAFRLNKQDSDSIARTLDKIENIKKIRDTLAHAVWEYDDRGRAFSIIIKTVGQVKYERTPRRAQDIIAHAHRLQGLAGDLCNALQKHGYLPKHTPHNGKYL